MARYDFAMTADVCIIGGGIVGSSIAWHLADAGCTNVVVLEREAHQGKGSTGKSMGGVRAQFSSEPNIRMSLYSIAFYASFEERFGEPSGYRPQGYLFLATDQAKLDYLTRNVELQHACGRQDVRLMSTQEVRDLYPQLILDDVLGASFGASDGFVDPHLSMTGFATAAKERGVKFLTNAEVTSLSRTGNSFAIHTAREHITAKTVVNAAGAWAASIGRMLDIDLPVSPLRRMLVPTEPFDQFPHSAPMIIDMATGFHFRPEGRGFLLAWNDPDETPGYKLDFAPDFVEKILDRAAARVPIFENVAVNPKRAWAGLYEMTPDHHPVFGESEDVPGFYFANGFSGHGVMHAPSTGKITADLILKGDTDLIDWRLFSHTRFAEDRLIHETAVL
jgi:sarcosine oxidase subunit beta